MHGCVRLCMAVHVGLGMSPGLRQVLMSILMGILTGNVTHGSSSPTKTDHWGSGCGFYRGGYPPWVPAIYPPKFPIYKLNFTISFEYGMFDSQINVIWKTCVEYWDSSSQYSHALSSTTSKLPQMPKHQHLTHMSPSSRRGMWANVNLALTPWTQNWPSNPPWMPTMQVQQQWHEFDDNVMDSTTPPWVLQQ